MYANEYDAPLAGRYAARLDDWRNGAVVYQVLVDRFAPSRDLAAKAALYAAPRVLRGWDEAPRRGRYLDDVRLWSHEIEFWGGDLASLRERIGHVHALGADVLYLNPIHHAFTNHKYDALDYRVVSPEFGTREDVRALADELHARGMKLVLDGVFNHMGRRSERFRGALDDRASPLRDWFVFGDEYPGGARAWWRAQNLPELNLEHPAVREDLWGGPDSVVRGWLRDGADGWRLDVAFDIGFRWLTELTAAAHAQKPGSLVIGELANYPQEWFPAVDGVMHFTLRHLLLGICGGAIGAAAGQRMIERLCTDAGLENMLKSWIYLDNHDTPRLATVLPDVRARRIAQVLQFTLPGSPNLYYGTEVAMTGGDDPEMRGPMRWDRVDAGHPELDWTRTLIAMRRAHPALRVGDLRWLPTTDLIGFQRRTDRAGEGVVVLVNPSDREVVETVLVPDSKVMDCSRMGDLLPGMPGSAFADDGEAAPEVRSALFTARMPPMSYRVMRPMTEAVGGYTQYKRVQ